MAGLRRHGKHFVGSPFLTHDDLTGLEVHIIPTQSQGTSTTQAAGRQQAHKCPAVGILTFDHRQELADDLLGRNADSSRIYLQSGNILQRLQHARTQPPALDGPRNEFSKIPPQMIRGAAELETLPLQAGGTVFFPDFHLIKIVPAGCEARNRPIPTVQHFLGSFGKNDHSAIMRRRRFRQRHRGNRWCRRFFFHCVRSAWEPEVVAMVPGRRRHRISREVSAIVPNSRIFRLALVKTLRPETLPIQFSILRGKQNTKFPFSCRPMFFSMIFTPSFSFFSAKEKEKVSNRIQLGYSHSR